MSLKIKLAVGLGVAMLAGLAAWYVQDLRADNAALSSDNIRLLAVAAVNESAIQELQALRQQDERLLQQWVEEKAALLKTQEHLARQIQKELKISETFKAWADNAYNPNAYRLLQSANNHRISDN
jgi:hypothetical protein